MGTVSVLRDEKRPGRGYTTARLYLTPPNRAFKTAGDGKCYGVHFLPQLKEQRHLAPVPSCLRLRALSPSPEELPRAPEPAQTALHCCEQGRGSDPVRERLAGRLGSGSTWWLPEHLLLPEVWRGGGSVGVGAGSKEGTAPFLTGLPAGDPSSHCPR